VLFYEEGLGFNGLVCDSALFIEWVTSYDLASQCGPPEIELGQTVNIRRYVRVMFGISELY
jgi:hypothetical protein